MEIINLPPHRIIDIRHIPFQLHLPSSQLLDSDRLLQLILRRTWLRARSTYQDTLTDEFSVYPNTRETCFESSEFEFTDHGRVRKGNLGTTSEFTLSQRNTRSS